MRDDEPRPVWMSLLITGTREEPGTLTQGAPVFPGSSRLGIEPTQDGVCVCLLLQDLLESCARGGGGEWRTCAMRYDEPRLVWTRLTTTH